MSYRLVCLDIDGTILSRDRTLSPRVRSAMAQLQASGVGVTVATGRMYQGTASVARALALTLPVICYQGAVVRDVASGRDWVHYTVPLPDALAVAAAMAAAGLSLAAYLDERLLVEEPTPEALFFARLSGVSIYMVPTIAAALHGAPTALAGVGDADRCREVADRLRAEFGARLRVFQSGPTLCEVAHPDSGKGRALAMLAARLGVARDAVVAVGDGWNDIDMLEWAGLGVAMGGSRPDVLAAADLVIDPVEADGAAVFIEALLDGRQTATLSSFAGR